MAEIITPITDPRESYMSLEDVRAIPKEKMPVIIYCDGGSLFGWLIRRMDHSAASHMQILYDTDKVVSQWFWLRTIPIDSMKDYNCKFIWNPSWTKEDRETMYASIIERLAMSRWATQYDVWGVIGEALNWKWLQKQSRDFCSEFVARVMKLADIPFREWLVTNPSPTPKEINWYTKIHNPPYKVLGRYMVDDEEREEKV